MKIAIIIFIICLPWILELIPKSVKIINYLRAHNRVRKAFYVAVYVIHAPTTIAGYILYYISKLIKALGYFLMKANYSAKKEITNWYVYTEVADALF